MAMTLITTNTSSNAATSSFTSGIDSTYKLYIFKFYDINPATNSALFSFQANAAGASGYNETMTTTFFTAWQSENGVETLLSYLRNWGKEHRTALAAYFQYHDLYNQQLYQIIIIRIMII